MTNLYPVRRALISVSDKTGLIGLAKALSAGGIEILSTGGSATAIRNAGIDVRDVADATGFPEMMDGRVKTLHPMVHGGLLALRDNDDHTAAMEQHGIGGIDLLIVNLYRTLPQVYPASGVLLAVWLRFGESRRALAGTDNSLPEPYRVQSARVSDTVVIIQINQGDAPTWYWRL